MRPETSAFSGFTLRRGAHYTTCFLTGIFGFVAVLFAAFIGKEMSYYASRDGEHYWFDFWIPFWEYSALLLAGTPLVTCLVGLSNGPRLIIYMALIPAFIGVLGVLTMFDRLLPYALAVAAISQLPLLFLKTKKRLPGDQSSLGQTTA